MKEKNMNEPETILDELDAELRARLTARRDAIVKTGLTLGVLATAPTMLTALAGEAFGQGAKLPGKIADVLNFALTLEYLEDEFYRTALNSSNLIPNATRSVFAQISRHETAHVALLRSVLGGKAVAKPNFDFTANNTFPDVFTNYQTFLALSQAFEDTGVRAYKGQAGNLKSNDKILTTALQIHSVEARHASEVRRIREQKGWITGDSRGDLPAVTQPIYNGEGNAVQGGADLLQLGFASAAVTEAFDEPLTKDQVLAIAKLFIRG
jgi:rubrerythrin